MHILPYIAINRIEELFENGFFRFWDGDTQTKRTVQVRFEFIVIFLRIIYSDCNAECKATNWGRDTQRTGAGYRRFKVSGCRYGTRIE